MAIGDSQQVSLTPELLEPIMYPTKNPSKTANLPALSPRPRCPQSSSPPIRHHTINPDPRQMQQIDHHKRKHKSDTTAFAHKPSHQLPTTTPLWFSCLLLVQEDYRASTHCFWRGTRPFCYQTLFCPPSDLGFRGRGGTWVKRRRERVRARRSRTKFGPTLEALSEFCLTLLISELSNCKRKAVM